MASNGRWVEEVTVLGARLMWRNFSGNETRFKKEGVRTFHVVVDEKTGKAMLADGWNMKEMPPREEGDPIRYRVEVEARFNNFPPHMVMITHKGRTKLTEDMLPILDWAEFDKVDLILRPRKWQNDAGETRVKAYLKTGFFTIREDELELMYADVPDAQGGVESLMAQAEEDVAPF